MGGSYPTYVKTNHRPSDTKTLIVLTHKHITHLNTDPTDKYQKQIQQAIQKCNTLIYKHTQILNEHKTHGT
jgi:hypothetical protein